MPSSRHAGHLARFLAAVMLCALAPVLTPGSPASAAGAWPVDPYAGYVGQSTCAHAPLPGTAYLMSWLLRQYPGTSSASMLRSCGTAGVSEHKDGRALDWAVDASDPADKARVDDLLARLFATDEAGNPHALARRMGIMYLIWDDHIYRAYDREDPFSPGPYLAYGCKNAKSCSDTLQHRDHVHVSLSWAGAAAQTSFYRTRGVTPVPVYYPGTRQLDPTSTAVAKVEVPATGETVTTPFRTSRGTTYRIVADGLYRYGPGSRISDGACAWSGGGWTSSDKGLLVNGRSPWDTSCQSHTVSASFTAHRNRRLHLRVGDDTARDNAGSLTFYVLREDIPPRAVAARRPVASAQPRLAHRHGPPARRLRTKEVVHVPAAAAGGVRTRHSLKRRGKYRVVVRGTASSGGTAFDGQCVKYAGRYRPQHTLDLTQPTADHLSVYVAGRKVHLHVPHARRSCAPRRHRYVGRFRAPVRGRATVRVFDPFDYSDNSGSLRVKLVKR